MIVISCSTAHFAKMVAKYGNVMSQTANAQFVHTA
jgi:predicted small integral membrane protein